MVSVPVSVRVLLFMLYMIDAMVCGVCVFVCQFVCVWCLRSLLVYWRPGNLFEYYDSAAGCAHLTPAKLCCTKLIHFLRGQFGVVTMPTNTVP